MTAEELQLENQLPDCTPEFPAIWEPRGRMIFCSRQVQKKIDVRPYLKKNKNKKAGDMDQIVECLLASARQPWVRKRKRRIK
jgi:hypothetical protein